MAQETTPPVEDPSQGSPITDFFGGPTAQDKLRARAYDLMQRSSNNPRQQALIAQEAAAIERGERTTPQYEADLVRDNVRRTIWENATELKIDPSDPVAFSDIAVSTILRHKYPGAERDAALVLQWRQMREAQINAAALQKNAARGNFQQPVYDETGKLLSFDTRAQPGTPNVYDPATGKLVKRPVKGAQYSPELQGDISFSKETGQEGGKNLFTQRQLAMDATNSLLGIGEARKLLDEGMKTGKFANFQVGLGATLHSIGISYKDSEVENAQAFTATMAKQVATIIKAFGAGTGLSDADREFAIKAAGGDITFNEESIRKVLDINERASLNVIKNYKDLQGRVKGKYTPYSMDVPEVPASQAKGDRAAKVKSLLEKYGKKSSGK